MGTNRHQDLHALLLLYHNPAWSPFIHQHKVISTIAIIAKRDQISTYILQVIGNHLTSIELNMGKYIFDPRPTKDSRYICLDKESIYATSVSNQLL